MARTTRTLEPPSTESPLVKNVLSSALAAGKNGKLVTPQGVEQTGELTAPLSFSEFSEASVQESRSILEEVIDGLDAAFDSACSIAPGIDSNHGTHSADDEASIQELFCQIAATYSTPLKNLVFALQNHTATNKNIEFCRPILHTIRSAAETINLNEAVQRMEQFDAALAEGQACADQFLKDKIRMKILDAYGTLAEVLPDSFQFGEESQKREDIIIHSLLQQIPGVGQLTFEKLSRSGLGSLSLLLSANPEDLAAATGIQRKLCVKICNKIQDYSKRAAQRASQTSQSGHHSRLLELIDKLRNLSHREKGGVALYSALRASGQGRHRRQRRTQILLEVNVILAELGELKLIFQLQKASLKKQVQILNQLLYG